MTGKPANWHGSDGKARAEVVSYLTARGGEVAHNDGLAVIEMQQHLGRSRSLSNLLRTMEHDGMIAREVRGRRTYRIQLVDDWGMASEASGGGTVTPLRPLDLGSYQPDSNVDYDLLASSLLAIVLRRTTETPPSVRPDKVLANRLRKSEATITKLEAQLQEIEADRRALRARVGELEDQGAIYEHNMTLLRAELDKPKSRRGGGTPLADRLSSEERGMLAELMRALPETPQSRPRKTR